MCQYQCEAVYDSDGFTKTEYAGRFHSFLALWGSLRLLYTGHACSCTLLWSRQTCGHGVWPKPHQHKDTFAFQVLCRESAHFKFESWPFSQVLASLCLGVRTPSNGWVRVTTVTGFSCCTFWVLLGRYLESGGRCKLWACVTCLRDHFSMLDSSLTMVKVISVCNTFHWHVCWQAYRLAHDRWQGKDIVSDFAFSVQKPHSSSGMLQIPYSVISVVCTIFLTQICLMQLRLLLWQCCLGLWLHWPSME